MTLRQEDARVIKYEVRSTKYEVKKLGATELRGMWLQSRGVTGGVGNGNMRGNPNLAQRSRAEEVLGAAL